MTVFTKFWVADHEYASHFVLSHQVISQFQFGSNHGMDGDLHSGVGYIVHAIALVQTVQISHN